MQVPLARSVCDTTVPDASGCSRNHFPRLAAIEVALVLVKEEPPRRPSNRYACPRSRRTSP